MTKKTTQANPAAVREIRLDAIQADPNQPRKSFNDEDLRGLAASIIVNGVLSPIMVRPVSDLEESFVIVYGERRFRASQLAGRETIPALVRHLTDREVLEAQLIENLQREGVHPMEEAQAYKKLRDGGMSTAEIGDSVGKGDRFVRQRIFLTRLLPEWQKVFRSDSIGFKEAVRVAQLSENDQRALYADKVDEDDRDLIKQGKAVSVRLEGNWAFSAVRRLLAEAPFNTEDPTLNPKMGVCSVCPFNSACMDLFQGDAHGPACNNTECYETKVRRDFENKTQAAVEQGLLVVDIESFHDTADKQQLAGWAKKNIPVLDKKDVEVLQEPDPLESYENWVEDQYEGEDEETLRVQYENVVKDYQAEMESYRNKTTDGRYQRALVACGDKIGREVWVRVKKGALAKAKDLSSAPLGAQDIIQELKDEKTGILNREKRSKELDREKVQPKISEALAGVVESKDQPATQGIEATILRWYILHSITWYAISGKVKQNIGLGAGTTHPGGDKLWDLAQKMTQDQFNAAFRALIHQDFASSLPQHNGFIVREMVQALVPGKVEELEAAQKDIATKRAARVKQRIEAIDKKIQAAKKPETPAAPVAEPPAQEERAKKRSDRVKAAIAEGDKRIQGKKEAQAPEAEDKQVQRLTDLEDARRAYSLTDAYEPAQYHQNLMAFLNGISPASAKVKKMIAKASPYRSADMYVLTGSRAFQELLLQEWSFRKKNDEALDRLLSAGAPLVVEEVKDAELPDTDTREAAIARGEWGPQYLTEYASQLDVLKEFGITTFEYNHRTFMSLVRLMDKAGDIALNNGLRSEILAAKNTAEIEAALVQNGRLSSRFALVLETVWLNQPLKTAANADTE